MTNHDYAPKIVFWHAFPPIPDRNFDWAAYYEGEEEDGNYGWGSTKEEALSDLLERYARDEVAL